MELKGKKWENYSTPFIDSHKDNETWKNNYPDELKLQTLSVGELLNKVMWMKENADCNHKDIYDIPVFIKFNDRQYTFTECSFGFGQVGAIAELTTDKSNELVFTAPDSKPENGEYWCSRGPSNSDCSGFIKSKLAGERLRRLVRYILDKDDTESWLDFRVYEPNWIQFKFSSKEFDVEKLDQMARDNGDIVNEQILRECKK